MAIIAAFVPAEQASLRLWSLLLKKLYCCIVSRQCTCDEALQTLNNMEIKDTNLATRWNETSL
jgi:hypothetical protein